VNLPYEPVVDNKVDPWD